VYAALILQGLYHVPQVRMSIARWRPPMETPDAEFVAPPTSGEGPPTLSSLLGKLTSTHHLFRPAHVDIDRELYPYGPRCDLRT
jgi:hypothetical protein